jgi:hypothetical protein
VGKVSTNEIPACHLDVLDWLATLCSDMLSIDRLCGLVVRVVGYRSGGQGSIPGTTRKKFSGSGTGCTQPRE